jgi:hypothetical protein
MIEEKGELIIRAKKSSDFFDRMKHHIYFLYQGDVLFDEILPGEVKKYIIDKPITLVLGHKRGSFINAAMPDSAPITIFPGKTTRLEAAKDDDGFMPRYFLSEVDVINSD